MNDPTANQYRDQNGSFDGRRARDEKYGHETRRRAQTNGRSFGDLLSELAGQTSTLLKQEVALVKTEVRRDVRSVAQEARTAAADTGTIAAGGAIALAGFIALVIGLGWLLGEVLLGAEWLGISIMGLVVALIGYGIVRSGMSTLKNDLSSLSEIDLTPTRTVRSLKEDKEWLKNEV